MSKRQKSFLWVCSLLSVVSVKGPGKLWPMFLRHKSCKENYMHIYVCNVTETILVAYRIYDATKLNEDDKNFSVVLIGNIIIICL